MIDRDNHFLPHVYHLSGPTIKLLEAPGKSVRGKDKASGDEQNRREKGITQGESSLVETFH